MNLQKFTISIQNESMQKQDITNILINPAHIISMKPIKMSTNDQRVIEAFWIRLSNGKKYKAIQIPSQYADLLKENLPEMKYVSEKSIENHIQ